MSNEVFPTLLGLTWPVDKTPTFSTIVQRTASLQEVRVGLAQYPLMRYTLVFDFLTNTDLATLAGFFMARQGALDSFLLDDTYDDLATAQIIGTGTGAQTTFQMIRAFGVFAQPVYNVKPSAPTPLVYLNGVAQPTGWSITSAGVLTFVTPPTLGVVITATFGYWWRVRFEDDATDFSRFMSTLTENQQLNLVTVLGS